MVHDGKEKRRVLRSNVSEILAFPHTNEQIKRLVFLRNGAVRHAASVLNKMKSYIHTHTHTANQSAIVYYRSSTKGQLLNLRYHRKWYSKYATTAYSPSAHQMSYVLVDRISFFFSCFSKNYQKRL